MFKIFLLILLLNLPSLIWSAPNQEERLKQAITFSNQGKNEDAIALLISLSAENSNDYRVFLSLGLIYRGMDKLDEAINALERSVQIKPTEDCLYALSLIYEAMSARLPAETDRWSAKACASWNDFLRLNPVDTKRSEVAYRHIRQLQNNP